MFNWSPCNFTVKFNPLSYPPILLLSNFHHNKRMIINCMRMKGYLNLSGEGTLNKSQVFLIVFLVNHTDFWVDLRYSLRQNSFFFLKKMT